MRILECIPETFVDGPGVRYSVYVAGCENQCKGCHNPQSWSFDGGFEYTDRVMASIILEYQANPMLDGFTIAGGEPLHPRNRKGTMNLVANMAIQTDDIWLYTGYTLEQLLQKPIDIDLLYIFSQIAVLVDGPYIEERKTDAPFRGSDNQRMIRIRDMISAGTELSAENVHDYVYRL